MASEEGWTSLRLNPRQEDLVERLRRDRVLSISALADALQVSTETIRRDVRTLAAKGVVVKQHGNVPEGSFFLNVGSTNTNPWIAMDVASAFRNIFVLQNHIAWVKSVSIGDDNVPHTQVRSRVLTVPAARQETVPTVRKWSSPSLPKLA